MTLIALGINHNTASVDVREKVAFGSGQIHDALRAAREAGLTEAVILSTCNRTEIYGCTQKTVEEVLSWLANYKKVERDALTQAHYLYSAEDAASHMMKVASGLDSLVLGEPQILGQMKSAYAVAQEADCLGGVMHEVFQRVFSVAKRVRSETAIGENPVSVAYAAVSLAQQIFSDLKQDTALLIGAGETIELVARHLNEQGIKKLIVANRTLENAQHLAEQFNAEAILLADIPEHLHRADIIISSTASQLPLLGKGAVEQALKRRKHKPMFMVDIAVPRDIESQVGDLGDVYLYTVDDLKEVIDENKRSRQQAAQIAQGIIAEGLKEYVSAQRALESVDTIKTLRTRVDGLREQEVDKYKKMLSAGGDPEELLEQLARSLTNKFLHSPSAELKRAAAEGESYIVECADRLFDLSHSAKNSEKE